jgi:transcriptional repressor NrdR
LRGIVRACEKTGVSHAKIDSIVDNIEVKLQQSVERELSSNEIGELVLQHLRQENEVAYIRFASVYRKFQGIQDFVETLNRLQQGSCEVRQSDNMVWKPDETSHSPSAILDCLF